MHPVAYPLVRLESKELTCPPAGRGVGIIAWHVVGVHGVGYTFPGDVRVD